jgi:hypothetical protein
MNAVSKCYYNLIMDLLNNDKFCIEGVDVAFNLSLMNDRDRSRRKMWTVASRDYYHIHIYVEREKIDRKKLKDYQIREHLRYVQLTYSPQEPKITEFTFYAGNDRKGQAVKIDHVTFNKILQSIEDYLEMPISEATKGLIDYIEIKETKNDDT